MAHDLLNPGQGPAAGAGIPPAGPNQGLPPQGQTPTANAAPPQHVELVPADSVQGIRPVTAPEKYNEIDIPQSVVLYVGTVGDTGEEVVQSVGFDPAVIGEEELNAFVQSVLPTFDETKQRTGQTPVIGGDMALPPTAGESEI